MRNTHRGLASRIAATLLIAGLLAPALARAAEDEPEPAQASLPDPAVGERWYDQPLRMADQVVDLIVIRPLSALTLLAGAGLFIPAAALSAPNGMEGIRDAYERFVSEPGEYFWSRPLGEF
jgi:hypothetical protein